jgi:hypothetical protein
MLSAIPFEVIPTLTVMREIYAMPLDRARFDRYLELIRNDEGDLRLPLVTMNPMGQEHCLAMIDTLIALDAERVAADAAREAAARLPEDDRRPLGVAIVLADDRGGWTNRWLTDFLDRFPENRYHLKRNWSVALIWASETASAARVRAAILASIARTVHQRTHGIPATLDQMLRQEGTALAFSGATMKRSASDIADLKARIAPHRDSTDRAVQFAVLYGDGPSKEAGYTPLGIPYIGGFDLALAEARVHPSTSSG